MYNTCITFTPGLFNNKKKKLLNYEIIYPLTGTKTECIKKPVIHKKAFYEKIKFLKTKKRFAIIILFIKWTSQAEFEGAHFNSLLFDFKYNTVERFETYGKIGGESEVITSHFDKLFEKDLKKEINFSYIRPLDFCPIKSFQEIEEEQFENIPTVMRSLGNRQLTSDPGGYCGAWSLWYLDYFLLLNKKFKKISREEVLVKAISFLHGNENSFRTFIRNYSKFIVDQRNKLIKKSNIKLKLPNMIYYGNTLEKLIKSHFYDLLNKHNN